MAFNNFHLTDEVLKIIVGGATEGLLDGFVGQGHISKGGTNNYYYVVDDNNVYFDDISTGDCPPLYNLFSQNMTADTNTHPFRAKITKGTSNNYSISGSLSGKSYLMNFTYDGYLCGGYDYLDASSLMARHIYFELNETCCLLDCC